MRTTGSCLDAMSNRDLIGSVHDSFVKSVTAPHKPLNTTFESLLNVDVPTSQNTNVTTAVAPFVGLSRNQLFHRNLSGSASWRFADGDPSMPESDMSWVALKSWFMIDRKSV